ncbi:hypothetical protein BB560_004147 [Smittium megazygosporum]|uniref:GTP cyclohydrolase 1 n=1 Tax=Smittium megazygosporum TaxID=133381 RepID=A0A2T9Z9Z7_9FUNG|nr:hypothetical protein BB560_004147 [Smittium megazygosporum]
MSNNENHDSPLEEVPKETHSPSLYLRRGSMNEIMSDSIYKKLPIEHDGLSWPASGTRQRRDESQEEKDERLDKLKGAIQTIIECLGEDPTRSGIVKTPERYAKAMLFFTRGYERSIKDVMNEALFEEDHEEMVIVKDITTFSLFRIAEMFSQRLQVQERLTKQIAISLNDILKPQGVAVLIESRDHLETREEFLSLVRK